MNFRHILFGSALFAQACSSDTKVEPENKPNLRTLTSEEVQVSKSNEAFAFNMYNEVCKIDGSNIFVSPISISTALGMTLNGAEGETKDGILKAIDFDGLAPADVNEGYKGLSSLLQSMDKKVTFKLANSVWYKNSLTINSDFSDVVKNYYDGNSQALNFAAPETVKKTINDWVDNNTNHKIKNIIEDVPGNSVMYLVNATYFKGTWLYQFDKSLTKKDNFYNKNGDAVQLDMMTSKDAAYGAATYDGVTIVDMPYGNGQFSMTVLMPVGDNTIEKTTAKLSPEYLENLLSAIEINKATLVFPKFKMSWKHNLNQSLTNLGMGVAFTDKANFPYLFVDKLSLSITEVVHQSFIEVNEEGTEATAATSVGIGPTSINPDLKIVIDHPFLFVIREKHSRAILFIGQLVDLGGLGN